MDPGIIKMALERRGTFLNRGIDPSVAIQIARDNNIEIDSYITGVFSSFNGFQDGALDPGSGIRIWPLEEILRGAKAGQGETPFADFLINSNEYTFSIENAFNPVRMDGEVVAESFPDFLEKMTSGQFDFLNE